MWWSDQVTRVLHSTPCSATTVLEQTAQAKPCSHTFCHSRKSQPAFRQHDPLENQWEEQGALWLGSTEPYRGGHRLNQVMGIPSLDTVFLQKELKHIVMARRRYLSLLNTLTVNSLLLLGALLNDRTRHDRLSWVMSLLWLGVFFCSAAKTHTESLYVQLRLTTKLSGTLW